MPSVIDFAVAAAIFLTFFILTFNYVMDYLGKQIDTSKLQEMKTVVLDYFRALFESKGLPENWEESTMTEVGVLQDFYRIPIVLNETIGLTRTNEPIDISVSPDASCENKAWNSTLRVLDENATEVQSDVYDVVYCSNQFVKEAKLVFLANVSANQAVRYYLYFSPEKNISAPNYTTDLNYTTYLENSMIRINVTGEVAEIYNKNTSSGNIVGGRAFGIVQYNSTTDTTKQTDNTSGTVSTLVDGKVKKMVQINGSTDWFLYKVNITLYAYNGYFIWDAWINESQAMIVHDFKQPEVNLSTAANTIAYRNDTGNYISTASSGNIANASWLITYDSSTARDSLAIVVKNYTTWNQSGWNSSGVEYSFSRIQNEYNSNNNLSIAQYQIFDDNPVYVYPVKSTSPTTTVDTFYNKTRNSLVVSIYPREKLSVLSVAKLKALRNQNYTEVVRMLGGYEFSIEISE